MYVLLCILSSDHLLHAAKHKTWVTTFVASASIVTSNPRVVTLQEPEIDLVLNTLRATLNSSKKLNLSYFIEKEFVHSVSSPG